MTTENDDLVKRLSVDEIETLILQAEPDLPASVDGSKIWTRRMAKALHDRQFALDRLSAQGEPVAVKPLEWVSEPPFHVARVTFGHHYAIEVNEDGVLLRGTMVNRAFHSFSAAKAAAQADYEQRIRSALVAALNSGAGK